MSEQNICISCGVNGARKFCQKCGKQFFCSDKCKRKHNCIENKIPGILNDEIKPFIINKLEKPTDKYSRYIFIGKKEIGGKTYLKDTNNNLYDVSVCCDQYGSKYTNTMDDHLINNNIFPTTVMFFVIGTAIGMYTLVDNEESLFNFDITNLDDFKPISILKNDNNKSATYILKKYIFILHTAHKLYINLLKKPCECGNKYFPDIQKYHPFILMSTIHKIKGSKRFIEDENLACRCCSYVKFIGMNTFPEYGPLVDNYCRGCKVQTFDELLSFLVNGVSEMYYYILHIMSIFKSRKIIQKDPSILLMPINFALKTLILQNITTDANGNYLIMVNDKYYYVPEELYSHIFMLEGNGVKNNLKYPYKIWIKYSGTHLIIIIKTEIDKLLSIIDSVRNIQND